MPRMVRRRPLALAVALIAVALASPVDAKKKKGGAKKHKPPAGKSLGAEPKGTSDAEESSSSSSSSSDDDKEEESKPAAKSPPPDMTDDKPPSDSDAEDKPARKKKEPAPEADSEAAAALPALEFVAGAGAMFRNLAYNQDRSMTVAPYSLAPGPEARIGLDVYPAAFATSGFAANIGLTAQLGYGFGVKSQTMSGTQLTTQFMDYAAGLKLRIPLGMVNPYLFGTYAAQVFQLTGQNPPTTGPPVPAVAYSIIRPGLGARFVFSPMIDLDVSGAFLLLADAGQIKTSYWPRTTGNGIEAAVSLGVRFTPLIGLRAGLDFRQYGLAFNWRMGDTTAQVGGALDRYIVVWGGLQISLDGVGGSAASEPAPEEKPAKGKKKKKAEPEPEGDEPTE